MRKVRNDSHLLSLATPPGLRRSRLYAGNIFVAAPSFSEVHSAFSDLPQGGSVSELQLAVPARMAAAF